MRKLQQATCRLIFCYDKILIIEIYSLKLRASPRDYDTREEVFLREGVKWGLVSTNGVDLDHTGNAFGTADAPFLIRYQRREISPCDSKVPLRDLVLSYNVVVSSRTNVRNVGDKIRNLG